MDGQDSEGECKLACVCVFDPILYILYIDVKLSFPCLLLDASMP